MKTCKNCIHYKLCEYSVWSDREVKCRDFLSKDIFKEFVEELKKHSCNYDLPNYHSFEAIDVEVIDEIVDEVIKKLGIEI